MSVIIGDPIKKDLVNPSKIRYNGKVFYIQDANDVFYFSPSDKSIGKVYTNPNLVDIETSKKDLIVVEKI